MSSYKIEPMNSSHIEGVFEVSKLSLTEAWNIESIENELSNKLAKYLVALDENKVIGFLGMWVVFGEGDITNIAVHPEYRKQGIGNLLMDNLITLCKENNINSLTLEVRESNLPAQNLYKKHGFKEEGIRKNFYHNPKENAIIMWRHNI
ncbi:ribosomal protein S18-alanine N-acetyltransferase [Clostridium sp. LIBA-8841]|uniref:ribosomal protein S18-alanine N-acetyltransferase n=1 Tax=Clostridium sp. LIBA-8841 TaxID=2987530 RepID=UPI002AC5C9A2|nr:ribosomal protein S18-alanine N-acetyltransferase [Clostridium sp. LIBA-8841]MDZ5253116.1 ribosomal protein S18-alanine N-acetyltransferase [Clostridium sp. LIBA-8841]